MHFEENARRTPHHCTSTQYFYTHTRKTHDKRSQKATGLEINPEAFRRQWLKILGSAALPFPKAHLDPISRTNHNLALDLLLPIAPTHIDSFETLQNPRNRVAFPVRKKPLSASDQAPLTGRKARLTHLSQSKLLPNTDPWPSVERYIVPALRRPIFPALRTIGL